MTFKRLNFYLSPADEQELSSRLVASFPCIRFRDGDRWRADAAPFRESIAQCASGTVYLWNPGLFPNVPTLESDGWIEGAKTRYVIQFMRSIEVNGELRMGQMAASFEPSSTSESSFAQAVFRKLKSLGSCRIQSIETSSGRPLGPPGGSIVVGPNCMALVQAGAVLSAPAGVRFELVESRAAANNSFKPKPLRGSA